MARKTSEARTGASGADLGIAFAGSVGIRNVTQETATAKAPIAQRRLRIRFGLTPPRAALVAALAYGEGQA